MKGDKGNCQIIEVDTGKMILKTKFDTQENCQSRINMLLSLGTTHKDTITYKCKECNFWHLGTLVNKEKYGK